MATSLNNFKFEHTSGEVWSMCKTSKGWSCRIHVQGDGQHEHGLVKGEYNDEDKGQRGIMSTELIVDDKSRLQKSRMEDKIRKKRTIQLAALLIFPLASA